MFHEKDSFVSWNEKERQCFVSWNEKDRQCFVSWNEKDSVLFHGMKRTDIVLFHIFRIQCIQLSFFLSGSPSNLHDLDSLGMSVMCITCDVRLTVEHI